MKSNVKKSIFVYFAAIVVLAGLVAGMMAYVNWAKAKREKAQQEAVEQTQAEAETRLAKVKIVEIIPIPFTDILVLPGTTAAYEDIDLASKLSGVIEWIGPKEGGRVKKGEKLLQVEVKSVETQVSEAGPDTNRRLRTMNASKSCLMKILFRKISSMMPKRPLKHRKRLWMPRV